MLLQHVARWLQGVLAGPTLALHACAVGAMPSARCLCSCQKRLYLRWTLAHARGPHYHSSAGPWTEATRRPVADRMCETAATETLSMRSPPVGAGLHALHRAVKQVRARSECRWR